MEEPTGFLGTSRFGRRRLRTPRPPEHVRPFIESPGEIEAAVHLQKDVLGKRWHVPAVASHVVDGLLKCDVLCRVA